MKPDNIENKTAIGRPKELDGGKRCQVYLNKSSMEVAAELGDGIISSGIRCALRYYREQTDSDCWTIIVLDM